MFKTSWVLLLCYTLFLRVRYAQNGFVAQAFQGLERKGDALMNDARAPEGLKSAWYTGKDIVKKVADTTNFVKAGNGPAGARKAQ